MEKPLRAIVLTDSEADVAVLLRELRRGGYAPTCAIASSEAALRAALRAGGLDLVLCACRPPEFDLRGALDECSLPLVCVGEGERHLPSMPDGAYAESIGRDLSRLPGAVARAIAFASARRAQLDAEALAARRRRLTEALCQGLDEGVVVQDAAGRVVMLNAAAQRLLGWSQDDTGGRPFHDLIHDHPAGPADRADACALAGAIAAPFALELADERFIRRDGATLPVSCSVTPADGDVVLVFRDLSERRRLEDQLLHRAFRDPLTGLPNQALFRERLGQALLDLERAAGRVAVMFLDVDRFRLINNSLGHTVGDQLLAEIGRRLAASLGPEMMVARFGGDEFTVLLEGVSRTADATAVAELLIEELRAPFLLDGREIFITASIGIVFSGPSTARPGDLLRDADAALHQAKSAGRARYAIFDVQQNAPTIKRLDLETDLWRALQREEIEVHYQPVIELATGTIAGFEALARWRHPRHGLIPPMEFVPLAEETGLMVPIGRWVLERACRQTRDWHTALPAGRRPVVSVNLSAKEFGHPDLVRQVGRVLRATGLDPRCLKLEMTESILMEDAPGTVKTLRALKRLGVRLALDDFGTGYSSLAYLHRFPVDTVKIDQSFVQRLRRTRQSTAIVRAVTALAHDLGMDVTAEGIETAAQVAALRDAGCDLGQGFFYAPALPHDRMTETLRATAERGRTPNTAGRKHSA